MPKPSSQCWLRFILTRSNGPDAWLERAYRRSIYKPLPYYVGMFLFLDFFPRNGGALSEDSTQDYLYSTATLSISIVAIRRSASALLSRYIIGETQLERPHRWNEPACRQRSWSRSARRDRVRASTESHRAANYANASLTEKSEAVASHNLQQRA
jgi:hypothetical protein